MEFLIGLTNKILESDIEKDVEKSERRRSKPPPHLTFLADSAHKRVRSSFSLLKPVATYLASSFPVCLYRLPALYG